jgi:hypothetical protein
MIRNAGAIPTVAIRTATSSERDGGVDRATKIAMTMVTRIDIS